MLLNTISATNLEILQGQRCVMYVIHRRQFPRRHLPGLSCLQASPNIYSPEMSHVLR